jgi:hypothetical protein
LGGSNRVRIGEGEKMWDDSKAMRWGVLIAATVIVVRIALEQTGVPESICLIFGVAWLYFIFPVLFAVGIRVRHDATPYKRLLKDIFLFLIYTRVMVMLTYMLAYVFNWNAPRFAYPGGNVGENVSVLSGILLIPLRNLLIWVVMAGIIGIIIGSITLLLTRKASGPATA